MHHSGLLPLTFEGLEQGFGGKNCQNGSQGKPCVWACVHLSRFVKAITPAFMMDFKII